MQKHLLGNTGIEVSSLGFGTVKFGRNQAVKFPSPFELPSDLEIKNLLKEAKDLGVNVLDTAPAYGSSEERLGKLLEHRNDWVIMTKVGEEFNDGESSYHFTPEHAQFSIERSLKRLKTDYLDVVLLHSDGNDVYNIKEFGTLEFLAELKKKGIIRAFGVSTKTVEGGLLAVDQSDVVMVTYNPIHTEELPVIQYAHQNNKGIFIKKALMSGHLTNLPGDNPVQCSLEFIFQEKGISSVIIGTLNAKHLREAAKYCS